METTIKLNINVKSKLDGLKIHPRESYNEVINRMIGSSLPKKVDIESLTETIEILSDPQTMRDIAKGLEDYQKGRTKTLEQVKKELNIK